MKLTVVDVDPGLKGDTAQGNAFCVSHNFQGPNLVCYWCKYPSVHDLFGDLKAGKMPADKNAITRLG